MPAPDRRLRQDLRHAVAGAELQLHFHPRRALQDGALLGAEAQLRWPRRAGSLSPAALWPLLYSLGLTQQALSWMLAEACAAAATWPTGRLFITLPLPAPPHAQMLPAIGQALATSALPPDRLVLALPEPALTQECESTLLCLAALRDQGLGFELDNFGATTAALLPLTRLPLTGLKLDRTLLPALHQHPGAPALLSAALHMAAATGLEVTACGVETATQHAWLRQQGCTAAQGSLCGRHDAPWPHAAAPCAIRLAA